MERAVLLSGEHPSLPRAELEALLAVHDPGAVVRVDGRVATVAPTHAPSTDAALARVVLALGWGALVARVPCDAAGLEAAARAVARMDVPAAAGTSPADGPGTAAVESVRIGDGARLRRVDVERRLGAALRDAGHAIDLRRPSRRLLAWLTATDLVVAWAGPGPRRGAYDERVVERREHFMPVSLHPRRAASLVHLARAPLAATLYDPFCGTGGILLEAALDGYRVLGSDIDPVMAQGTLQTLADAGPEPLPGDTFVCDIGDAPGLVADVDAIVTDLPYGGASTTRREGAALLAARAFAAFAEILPREGRAVVGFGQPGLEQAARDAGLRVEGLHEERAHRSLTRRFAVVKRP